MKLIFILTFFALLLTTSAQTDSQVQKKLELALSFGTTSSGPASGFEAAMNASGLNKTMHGFFGPAVKHPFSKTGFGLIGFPWTFAASYNIDEQYSLGMSIGNSPIGSTHGYKSEANKMTFEEMHYTLFQIVPFGRLKVNAFLLSAGPAIFITKTNVTDRVGDNYDDYILHIGLMLEASIQYPTDTMLFGFINAQARIMTKDKLGAYDTKAIGSNEVYKINNFEVNYSSVFIGVGVGIRL